MYTSCRTEKKFFIRRERKINITRCQGKYKYEIFGRNKNSRVCESLSVNSQKVCIVENKHGSPIMVMKKTPPHKVGMTEDNREIM